MNQLGTKKRGVMYGSSDSDPNWTELLLAILAAVFLVEVDTVYFFFYPHDEDRNQLYHPYQPPKDIESGLKESGLAEFASIKIEFLTVVDLLKRDDFVFKLSLDEIVKLIQPLRTNKYFNVVNIEGRKVRPTRKDPRYEEVKDCTLLSALTNPAWKVGGSILYFLYGVSAARNLDIYHLLPKKRRDDVFNAFNAGATLVKGMETTYKELPNVIQIAELDMMSDEQWKEREKDGRWRKVPPWMIRELIKSPIFKEVVKRCLLEDYVALSYHKRIGFFFVKGQE